MYAVVWVLKMLCKYEGSLIIILQNLRMAGRVTVCRGSQSIKGMSGSSTIFAS